MGNIYPSVCAYDACRRERYLHDLPDGHDWIVLWRSKMRNRRGRNRILESEEIIAFCSWDCVAGHAMIRTGHVQAFIEEIL